MPNPARVAMKNRISNLRMRCEALVAYGGKCVCCGEQREVLLSLDHIDPTTKNKGDNKNLPRVLKATGWPPGFQVLCYNCNLAKRRSAVCPCQQNTLTAAECLVTLPDLSNGNKGTNQHLAKLTDEIVRALRVEYAAGGVAMQALADRYGVALQTIHKAIHRVTWKAVA